MASACSLGREVASAAVASAFDHLEDLVSLERGEVDRRVYVDQEIFDEEMRRIFGRAWLFLCHETQIPDAGDFFEAAMGQDNVLVVRQKDGSIRAFLNSCPHRGNAVCRAEEGNVRSFLCTYHGWSFGIDGSLKGVPGYKEFYGAELIKSERGLRCIAQLDVYKGFVFGTHDPDAPPLVDYLGATGRLSIDLLACKGDLVILPGVQKFVIDCNWKIAVDNLYDWYHPQVSHASAFTAGVAGPSRRGARLDGIDMSGVEMEGGDGLAATLGSISASRFDQMVLLGEYGHGIGGPTADSSGNVEGDSRWRERPGVPEVLGPIGVQVAGHPNVFPTMWLTVAPWQISLRIPRSPTKTEIWWFTFVDRSATPEQRQLAAVIAGRIFGPSGLLEQDDGENWAQATAQSNGLASQQVKHLVSMGVGRGRVISEHGLHRVEGLTSEHGQRWTYYAWLQWMRGLSWEALRAATTPGEWI